MNIFWSVLLQTGRTWFRRQFILRLRRINNRLRTAHLFGCPQDIASCVDSADRTYLPAGITQVLTTLDFIENGLNVCVLGPSDSGKSYLAKALGIVACANHRVGYNHCEALLEELVMLKSTVPPAS